MQEATVAFTGHLSKEELDAVGLGSMYFALFSAALTAAIGFAVNGVFAQAFGSKQFEELVVHLQRSLIISTFFFIGFTFFFLLNSEYILVWMAPDEKVSTMAGQFLLILLPGAYFRTLYQILAKYLESQNVALPTMLTSIVSAIASILFCLIFVNYCEWRLVGASLALSLSYAIMPFVVLLTAFYYERMWDRRIFKLRWTLLFSWAELSQLISLSYLSSFATYLIGDIGPFLAGLLGATELGAQSVLVHFSNFFYFVPVGLGSACTTRIGFVFSSLSAFKKHLAL